jgi:hypothetical protein
MPVTVEEVQKLIQEQFEGSDVHEIRERNHRVTGTIRWNGFNGKDIPERHRLITERVRNRFGMRGINIDVLFPLAPGESL